MQAWFDVVLTSPSYIHFPRSSFLVPLALVSLTLDVKNNIIYFVAYREVYCIGGLTTPSRKTNRFNDSLTRTRLAKYKMENNLSNVDTQ